jgi:hypothetical protein
MKKILLAAFLILLTFVTVTPHSSYAWSNGGFSSDPSNPKYGTHDWIAQHALDWLPDGEKQFIVERLNLYLYGTELPDNGKAPDGIGDTGKHHFYYNSAKAVVDDASAVRASEVYSQAANFLKSGDWADGVKYVGAMTHYIADLAVFGHVMGKTTDWGAEKHHEDYEDYVDTQTCDYFSEFNSYLIFDGNIDVISAYDAAKSLAYDTTFDSSGKGLTCVWMDRNYNWDNSTFRNRCGQSLSLAVNYVTDVLHTLWLEADKPIPEFTFRFTIVLSAISLLIAVAVLRVRLLHERNRVG